MVFEDLQTQFPAREQSNDWQQEAAREAYVQVAASTCSGSAELPVITILPAGTAKGVGSSEAVVKGPGFNLPTRGCRIIKMPAQE